MAKQKKKYEPIFEVTLPEPYTQRVHEKYQKRLRAVTGENANTALAQYKRQVVQIAFELGWISRLDGGKLNKADDLLDVSPKHIDYTAMDIFEKIIEEITVPNE
jgi:hypothetical protein